MKENKNETKTKQKNKEEQSKVERDEVLETSVVDETAQVNYEDLYKRALADYQNLKRRCDEEKASMIKFSNEALIEKLLGIVGDMEIATKHTEDDGIKSIYNKLVSILSSNGLTVIDPNDASFDSLEHEAVESIPGKKGKIMKVLQKGYKLNSKVLKPAIVAVGNGEYSL